MIVTKNDLYSNGKILSFTNDTELLVRKKIVFTEADTINAEFYTIKTNDNLDAIAYTYYSAYIENADKLWWIIADANNIENPLDLSELVGQEIMIPNYFETQLKLNNE